MAHQIRYKEGDIFGVKGKKVDGKILFSQLQKYDAASLTTDYSIKLVLKGMEKYVFNGLTKTVKPGQFLLVPPGVELQTQVIEGQGATGICIYLSKDSFEERCHDLTLEPMKMPTFPLAVSTTGRDVLQKVARGGCKISPDHYLNEILDFMPQFLSHYSKKVQGIKVKKWETKLHLSENLEKARAFMDEYFSHKMNLDKIAQIACLSPFHFQRNFKTVHGVTPTQYLMKLRIQHARKLISTGMPLHQVAMKSGFRDVRYLRKCLLD
ncbi:helix-turn-helix domain-containing protein [Flagellimonas myxillae]|uniref:helix-turn-helix domain-containing protein n=1 Tax=Flagellimonas myxillae TaxID=2942214 RepID=UPI00201E9750|nr:AraC family transcriptional regulator [Muricauda myxillae]MCL6265104.1 AraC family transcriptional regulator [Muricauda myxillae]